MPFDHIVVHIAGAQDVSVLKSNLDAANVPFEPDWGKSAKGFKVSNVWIGRDYFEFVEITNDDSVWRHEWVQRHLAGEHGAYCVFFRVDRDLEAIAQSLAQANIAHGVIEQTRFKWLFGLLEKRLPWRYLILPPLPGSRIEIGLIQYEPGAAEKNKPYMVPNGEDVGLVALSKAQIATTDLAGAKPKLSQLEQALGTSMDLRLTDQSDYSVQLKCETRQRENWPGFTVSDVFVAAE